MSEHAFIRLIMTTAILASFNLAICLTTPQNRLEVMGGMILSYSLLLGCLSLARAED